MTVERRSSAVSIEHRSGRLYEVETNKLSGYPISLYVFMSIFTLFFLFVITEPKHSFVFTVGENLRIPTRYSILTQSSYEINIPEGKEGAVDVFSLETCPTFSGQIINLNYEQDLLLNGQDYQYDYFILHPGSIVYAQVAVSKGSTYFYLLQGDVYQLESLRHGKSFDVNSFRAVNMVYVSDASSEGVVVTHTVKNEFAGRGQVWVLYYENQMSSSTTLHTRYAMKATSYNLNSFRPTCSTSSASKRSLCMVEANPCTIVQASNYYYNDDDDDDDGGGEANDDLDGGEDNNDGGDDDQHQQQNDDAFADADDQYAGNNRGGQRYYYNRAKIREVEVEITLNRNWASLVALTSLPTVLGLWFWISRRRVGSMNDVETSVDEAGPTDPGNWYQEWENGVKPAASEPSSRRPPSPSKRDFITSLYVPSSQWHNPAKSFIPPTNATMEMSNLEARPMQGESAPNPGTDTTTQDFTEGEEEEQKSTII